MFYKSNSFVESVPWLSEYLDIRSNPYLFSIECELPFHSQGRFHQHMFAAFSPDFIARLFRRIFVTLFWQTFLLAKFNTFCGERRLANGAPIWRISTYVTGINIIDEIELRIFCQTPCTSVFLLGAQSFVKSTHSINTKYVARAVVCRLQIRQKETTKIRELHFSLNIIFKGRHNTFLYMSVVFQPIDRYIWIHVNIPKFVDISGFIFFSDTYWCRNV